MMIDACHNLYKSNGAATKRLCGGSIFVVLSHCNDSARVSKRIKRYSKRMVDEGFIVEMMYDGASNVM